MKPMVRSYQTDNDFWRIRAFLRETFELNGRLERNWPVARLDYWCWHLLLNCQDIHHISNQVYIWETKEGQITAWLVAEDPGSVFLQTHPAYHNAALEEEMIALSEERLTIPHNGQQLVSIWSDSKDATRQEILSRRGFTRGKWTESQWRRDLHDPIPDEKITPGYTIRCLGDESELPARSWASWRGFHPDEPDEDYQGWEWYLNIQRCPLYRRDLDIVAVAPTGEIASFSTFWYDDATRSVYIEPVATVPEHYRLGLARACIAEGLRRVRQMGATRAFVSGFETGPNALYSSTLSPEHDEYQQWVKKW